VKIKNLGKRDEGACLKECGLAEVAAEMCGTLAVYLGTLNNFV